MEPQKLMEMLLILQHHIMLQTSSVDTNYYPKAGKDVFIIYSNNTNDLFDDKTETDWNGNFKFEYLRKGNYTVYTYVDSVVVNDVNYDYPVFYHVNISEEQQFYYFRRLYYTQLVKLQLI